MATGTSSRAALLTPLRYRRSIRTLSPQQLANLRLAFQKMQAFGITQDHRSYNYWAGVHGLPLPIDCIHGSILFFPWHRAYLYYMERALRDQVPDAMLAWWDWRTPAGSPSRIPSQLADAQTANGDPNPLHHSDVDPLAIQQGGAIGQQLGSPTRRQPSTSFGLPTPQEVADALAIPDFSTFSDTIESIHGSVHVWVGGHMGRVPFAGYDPIFWHHHTMIDRLWRMWQLRWGRPGPSQDLWSTVLQPFNMTVRRTLSVTGLGYDYASRTVSRPVSH